MRRPPSGEQLELRSDDQHAVVVEVGAGLRAYTAGERDVIDGYAVDQQCAGGRGQILLPWPNRIRGGRYDWEGEELQLAITDVEHGSAIHGLLAWRNWAVARHSDCAVTMSHVLHPTPGYPFELELEVTYELGEGGLSLTTAALNASDRSCPFGAGFHPYLVAPGLELIDDCEVRLPAASHELVDEHLIPYADEAVTGTPYDFRTARTFADTQLDTCFLDLERDEDGIVRASIAGPAGTTTVWADSSYGFFQAYSGDTLAPPERRRALALEPMTCAPNAFVTGEGLITLAPGARFEARCGIVPS